MNASPPTRTDKRPGWWWILLLALASAGLIAADLYRPPHGHFAFEAWPGISGAIGFGAAVVAISAAKGLRLLLKREEDYYGDE